METKLLPCVECGGDGFTMEPMYYDDGSLSRTLIQMPCAACSPQDSLQTLEAYKSLCDELAERLKQSQKEIGYIRHRDSLWHTHESLDLSAHSRESLAKYESMKGACPVAEEEAREAALEGSQFGHGG